jgi:PAS domain S-box-containing protein
MIWSVSPQIVPLGLGTILSLALAVYAWRRRRRVPTAAAFTVFNLGVAFWTGVYVIELCSAEPAALFWANMAYFGILVVPASWFVFALRFSGLGRWVTTRLLALLWIGPLATLLLVWTNPWHQWFRRSVHVTPTWEPGPAFWIHIAYSYALVLAGTVLVARRVTAGPRLWRGQSAVLLVAAFAPWAANAIYLAGLSPFGNLDLSPFGFGLTSLAVTWGVFRERLLDLVPVARDAVLEGMSDGVIVLDSSGRVVDVNPAAERLLGRSLTAAVGQPLETVLAGVADAVGEGGEMVLGEPPGERWIEHRRSALPEAPGGASGSVVVLRDTTKTKRAEEAVARSEARLAGIVDAAMDAVVSLDETQRIVLFNAAAERIFGCAASDALGSPVERFMPVRFRDAHREHVHLFDESGSSARRMGALGTVFGLRANGIEFPIEASVSVLKEAGGRRLYTVVLRDVTERKRAEQELRESEKRFRSLSEAAFEGIAITEGGQVVDVNRQAAEMLGYTVDEMTGRPVADFVAAESLSSVAERMRSGSQGLYEHFLRRKDGSVFAAEAHARAFPLHGRQLRVTALRDITERRRAEEEQARLSRAVAQAGESIVITDLDGTIVYVNPAFERITGYTRAEALGQNPRILKSGRHDEALYRGMWDTLVQGGVWSGRLVNRRKDGTFFDEDATIGPVRDTSGRLVNYVAVKRDVSSEALLQQELQRSEERFRRVVEHIQDALIIDDVAGRVVFANQHFADLLGYELEGAHQLTLEDYVAPEWRPALRDRHDRRVGGESVDGQFEFEALRRDGKRVWVEASVVPVFGEFGVITGTQSALRNVSERKRDQEALRTAANEWQRSFDSVDVALVLIGVDGRILRLNRRAQALSEGGFRELLGTDLRELRPSGLWREAAELALQPGDDRAPRATRISDSSSGCTWEVRVSEIAEAEPKRPRRLIIAASEVTATVRMEEALRRSETMAAIGSLAGGVAHEVRGPLFALSANLDALEPGAEPALVERLKPLRRSAARLNVLIDDLLDFARSTTGQLAKRPFEDVVREAGEDCLALAERAGVAIVSELDSPGLELLMDRDRLRQVFTNLLQNAIYHSPNNGTVRIKTETSGDWLRCLVSDQGPGFREDDLERVFEPFFTRRKGGTGLGLAIAKRIVEAHGGKIEARNQPGGGASMSVELPVAHG